MDVLVPPKRQRRLRPDGPSPVRHQDLQLGEVDRHIVQINRVTELVSCSWKDRCSSMDNHRDPIRFRRTINGLQFLHAIQVVIRIEQLVRRMILISRIPRRTS